MNKIIQKIDHFVFLLTDILFSLIPVALILGGGFTPIAIILTWYFDRNVNLNDLWYIFGGLLVVWMGFKWFDVVEKK